MCKFLTAILAVIPLSAAAQQFPNRPIRFVMAYPPGGSSDVLARPIANERLKRDGSGDVVLQLKSPWRDGTTHLRMTPLEFMQRLAALVPRARPHLTRFHGVLAPNAGLRAEVVPGPAQDTSVPVDADRKLTS